VDELELELEDSTTISEKEGGFHWLDLSREIKVLEAEDDEDDEEKVGMTISIPPADDDEDDDDSSVGADTCHPWSAG